MGGFRGGVGHHDCRSLGGVLRAAGRFRFRLAGGQLAGEWLEGGLLPYARGCLRRLVAAAVEGGECGGCGGGSWRWARIPSRAETETENAVEFSAVVACAGASRAVSLAGVCGGRPGRSMGSGLRERWGSQLRGRQAGVM